MTNKEEKRKLLYNIKSLINIYNELGDKELTLSSSNDLGEEEEFPFDNIYLCVYDENNLGFFKRYSIVNNSDDTVIGYVYEKINSNVILGEYFVLNKKTKKYETNSIKNGTEISIKGGKNYVINAKINYSRCSYTKARSVAFPTSEKTTTNLQEMKKVLTVNKKYILSSYNKTVPKSKQKVK